MSFIWVNLIEPTRSVPVQKILLNTDHIACVMPSRIPESGGSTLVMAAQSPAGIADTVESPEQIAALVPMTPWTAGGL